MRRNGMIDLFRFVYALLIMTHHTYLFGREGYPFSGAWVFVEFFFMLTGALTAKHFFDMRELDSKEAAKYALIYSGRKFLPYMPYVLIALLIGYISNLFALPVSGVREAIGWIDNLIGESLLLGASKWASIRLAPLWFLSALFLVFPFICYFLGYKKYKWFYVYIFSWIVPILYYGKMGIVARAEYPSDLMRAFMATSLGVFCYVFSKFIRDRKLGRKAQIVLTMIEVGCYLVPVIFTAFEVTNGRIMLIIFFIGIGISVSGRSTLSGWNCKLFTWLGQLSMIVFLIHWPILSIIQWKLSLRDMSFRLAVAYVTTIGLSVILNCLDRAFGINEKLLGLIKSNESI